VFVADYTSELILRDAFPRVITITGQLLNCASDKITNNYIALLNQLLNRHLIFKKLLRIDNASNHISPAKVQQRMTRVDLELDQFMKSAEKDSHKYKRNNNECFPYVGVWVHQRWLLAWVQTYLAGKTWDPHNLFHECWNCGMKNPRQITSDELKTEFFVCKHNIKLLQASSPYLQLKFFKSLVTKAKTRGDKVTGIIQTEASRKRWS
jgi:hypothetical protein